VTRPRPTVAAESSASGRGNAVGLTYILDRVQRSFLAYYGVAKRRVASSTLTSPLASCVGGL